MNTEQLKDLRDAIDACLAGKPVQFSSGGGWNNTTPGVIPSFDSEYHWRPKPDPTVRPWSKPEHVPLNCWIREKQWRGHHRREDLIIGISELGVFPAFDRSHVTSWDALDGFEHSTDRINWNPCTVEESA